MQRAKDCYRIWHDCHARLPKTHRYSLGQRIDMLFIEALEAIASAAFLTPGEKLAYVRVAIRKADTVKLLLALLWETKSMDTKRYAALAEKLDEVGRMLGGWSGQLTKRNSLAEAREK